MARIKYTIAGEPFASKKAVRARGQRILQSTPVGDCVKGEEFAFLKELFERYRAARGRNPLAITSIEVEPNTKGSGVGYRAFYEDGTSSDVSYNNAVLSLDGYDPHPRQVQAAMREAVEPQIIEFRYAEIRRGVDPDFAMCAEAHHLPPEFAEIIAKFLAEYGITFADIALEKIPGFRGNFLPEPWRSRFEEFHGEHARLKLLTEIEHRRITSENVRRKAEQRKAEQKELDAS